MTGLDQPLTRPQDGAVRGRGRAARDERSRRTAADPAPQAVRLTPSAATGVPPPHVLEKGLLKRETIESPRLFTKSRTSHAGAG